MNSIRRLALVLAMGTRTAWACIDCVPTFGVPATETETSRGYVRDTFVPAGYTSEEFFVGCRSKDGPYRTLVRVIRPADPARASGVAVLEPWHRGDNWTVYGGLKDHLALNGHAAIVVVADESVLKRFVRPANSERYRELSIPAAEGTEFEVIAQVGAALKQAPPQGLVVRKLILAGKSSSATVIRKYVIREHANAHMDGRAVYDGYFPLQSAIGETHEPLPDVDVPVVEIQGERELLLHFDRGKTTITYRRPNGPLYRLYEVPGMSHVSTRERGGLAPRDLPVSAAAYSDPRTWKCQSASLSPYPVHEVYHAAFDMLVRWVRTGQAPPPAPLIETTRDGREVLRDRWGNARGGWPSVLFDVPTGRYGAINGNFPANRDGQRCDWIGTYDPLPRAELVKLYLTHDAYVTQFDRRLDELVRQGFYLERHARALKAEARDSNVP